MSGNSTDASKADAAAPSGYHRHAQRVNDASSEGMERMRAYYEAHLLPHLPADRRARILDLGCGYGRILHALRKAGYSDLHGVDSSPEQVEAARRNGFTHVECGGALEHLERRPGVYDAIVLFDVVEHVPKQDLVGLLSRARASLKPGGRLVVQTPNGLSPLSPYTYGDFTHETAFTTLSVIQVLEAAGFRDVRVLPVSPHVHGVLSLARALLWHLAVAPLIRLYLLIAVGDSQGGVYTPNLIATAAAKEVSE